MQSGVVDCCDVVVGAQEHTDVLEAFMAFLSQVTQYSELHFCFWSLWANWMC